ncbi:MAG: PEP-CTERM sorting domain-containing protein [Anaerolineae bacterium]|nr:PEP-CTERM sorting domain-containing protein [Anaerolineae bacterium]
MKPQRCVLTIVAAFALLAGLVGVFPAPPVYADTFDLTGSCPGGVGDVPALIAAINSANANGEADTILLADGCVYTLAVPDNALNGLPVITSDITIDGGAGATIQRDPSAVDYFRIFEVYTGGALTLNAITVQNGDLTDSTSEVGGGINNNGGIVTLYASSLRDNHAAEGGGIYSDGQLFATLSTIADNTAVWGGGGILNNDEMQIEDTTVSGNIADFEGGGIRHFGSGSITRSTIVSNRALAQGTGGGISLLGGELQISNSTLSNNQALLGGAIHLLGMEVDTSLTITHTTVTSNSSGLVAGWPILTRGGATPFPHPAAGDHDSAPHQVLTSISVASAILADNGSEDCSLQPGTDYTSVGYSLVGVTCPATGPGDQTTSDPLLGPLADNGGPTWTHLPLLGSQAVDIGPVGACLLPVDQRGVDRPQDGNLDGTAACDAGSVEVQQQLDCGDAPDPTYPTLLASNGACHLPSPNAPGTLGAVVDLELDGQPTAAADGDDLADQDDEDGVTFTTALMPGGTAGVDVIVSEDGYLNAWLDFNADGDWADAGEHVFSDLAVVAGTNALNFAVPAGATTGTTYARFRYTADDPMTELSYDGLWWNGGEVEDYQVDIQPLLTLGDLVWYDTDADGIQDAGEPGVAGIVVDLYVDVCSGQAMASDTTDAAGNYLFTDLTPGVYCLQFSNIPAGWTISPQDQGVDDALDSDADPATAQITDINLAADDLDEDMGVYTTGSIGDRVFCDADSNGLYDTGEGVTAVGVTLYDDPGCDGVAVNLLSTMDSGVDGLYLFDELAVGLAGTLPECYVVEVDEADADLGDCDNPITPLSYTVALDTSAPDDLDNDFGFNQLLALGDLVWYDTDADGIQDAGEPGVVGIVVDLYARVCSGQALASDTTDAAGNYLFTGLNNGIYCLQFSNIPAGWTISLQDQGADDALDSDADPATAQIADINLAASDLDEDMGVYTTGSIGDRVFCDADSNGLYNAGEGVTAVGVTLYDDPGCDGVAVNLLSTIDSGVDGLYLFDELAIGLAGTLPECYVVEVDEADANLGDCNNPVTPLSYAVALDTSAPDDLDNDFGFGQRLALGDLVWEDLDQDGIQDAGEPGVEGVVATLYDTADCSGAEPLATEPTDAGGNYRFLDLSPGTYCIAFSNLPTGWTISPQDQGADDALDSDADPATAQISNIDLNASDLDQDIGIYAPATPTPTPTSTPRPTPTPTPPPAAPPVVPEPSTFVLMGGALAGLAGYVGVQIRARRRK